MAKENTTHMIRGCTLYWAHLEEPNKKSNKFQVNCTNLSKDDEKALKALGVNVTDGKEKGKAEMGMYVIAKATKKVHVVDSKRNTIEDCSNIGNGTKANVFINAYPYPDHGNGAGVGCGLQSVQITQLEEYSRGGVFEEEEGYTVPQADNVPFD
jgi:hypothetical protein